jgi:hypothetical protein
MHVARKVQLTVATFFMALGLFLVIGDGLFIRRHGVDYNDAAFVTRNDEAAEWPTGERPLYACLPAAGYGMGAWLVAALVFVLWPEFGKSYRGAVRRGAE